MERSSLSRYAHPKNVHLFISFQLWEPCSLFTSCFLARGGGRPTCSVLGYEGEDLFWLISVVPRGIAAIEPHKVSFDAGLDTRGNLDEAGGEEKKEEEEEGSRAKIIIGEFRR